MPCTITCKVTVINSNIITINNIYCTTVTHSYYTIIKGTSINSPTCTINEHGCTTICSPIILKCTIFHSTIITGNMHCTSTLSCRVCDESYIFQTAIINAFAFRIAVNSTTVSSTIFFKSQVGQ